MATFHYDEPLGNVRTIFNGNKNTRYTVILSKSHTAYLYVPGSEEKLSVQVALFNDVHISDIDSPLGARSDTHHGKVLQNFTANGPCTNL